MNDFCKYYLFIYLFYDIQMKVLVKVIMIYSYIDMLLAMKNEFLKNHSIKMN